MSSIGARPLSLLPLALGCRSRLLREMPAKGVERDVVCFNSAVTACAKSGRWEEAVGLLEEMVASSPPPPPPSSSSSSSSPSSSSTPPTTASGPGPAAERERDLSSAAGRRVPAGTPPSSLRGENTRGFGGAVRGEAAYATKGRSFCRPNVVTYNAAMQACGSAGRWREALRLLRALLAEGIAPNATSFTSAIAACGAAGEWQQARRLIGAVRKAHGAGLLSVASYNAAIKACGDAGRFEEAVEVLREMEADALSRGEGTPAPDATTYTAAIKASGPAHEHAIRLLREMPTKGVTPTRISYNAAISSCGRGGEWELAESLFGEMVTLGLSPDVISYNSLISAFGGAGQWERAVGCLREMLVLSSGLAAGGGGGGAGVVNPDAVSFAAASLACERAGRYGEAAGLRAEAAGLGLGLLKAGEAGCAGEERERERERERGEEDIWKIRQPQERGVVGYVADTYMFDIRR